LAHEGGEIVSLMHRPPLPAGNVPGTHFHWGLSRHQDHVTVGRKYVTNKYRSPINLMRARACWWKREEISVYHWTSYSHWYTRI